MAPSKKQVKDVLSQHNLFPKKGLGQNFLVDPHYQDKILQCIPATREDVLLEIGPGLGNLTESLLERAGTLIAVEKDIQFCKILQQQFAHYTNLHILNTDILSFDIRSFLNKHNIVRDKIIVFGNLPYYITTPILEHLVDHRNIIKSAYLTLQHEVAKRLSTAEGSRLYGRLSVFLQFYAELTLLATIPPEAFYPAPDVRSAFIEILFHEELPVCVKDEALFFELVKCAFSARRKNILNALSTKPFLGLDRDMLRTVFERCGLDPTRRAESFSIEELARLADYFFTKHNRRRQ
ncbi:MAG: ribosomal RNA small subunit methyltransferase A [Candidatus Omnitrophica bacterium]|nr:ribosomal RNA small subunit methyltransferase A [Candidatus Omnitrophota bacterium]